MSKNGFWRGTLFGVLLGLALLPGAADAQSVIAGSVTDTTSGVLPGVTVEASSPALIGQSRAVVTDSQGQYRVIDLRPGLYTLTFMLPGFTTVIRDGIRLEADFTATVSVQMSVGAVEETVTVSGESPIVDVQSTQRREVITRDMLNVLPTGRSYQTIAATLPAVSMGRFDVAGSTQMQQSTVTAYGSLGGDMALEVDGMSVQSSLSSGSVPAVYHNDGAYQEMSYQVVAGSAESQTGGVRINMIPREGGNQFSGHFVGLFSNTDMQGQNVTDDLRKRGLTTPAQINRLYDLNGSLGGPIVRNKLWFYSSTRVWAYNNFVANALNPDGSQAVDDNLVEAYNNRVTYQVDQKNKITGMYDKFPKFRGHRELEQGGVEPKATVVQTVPLGYNGQAKWTSTLTSRLLVEAGYSTNYYGFKLSYQPEVKRPSATDPFGDVSKVDLIQGTRRNAATQNFYNPFVAHNFLTSVSYVTGSHALKVGLQQRWGWINAFRYHNGNMIQRYRNGVPDSVQAQNTPVVSRSELNADLGLFVQDTWTVNRLTLNPGLRFEYFNGEVAEQDAPAGRFVPARHFDAIPNLPNWKNVAPRFGAAYDLFGDGKTAIKGSIGKYLQQEATGFPERYNPMVLSNDIRRWTDLNGDDIAQDGELGPSTNTQFGVRRNRNPDPDLQRSYQLLYNVGVQHELMTGLGLSVSYYRRGFYDLNWTDNLATTDADYTIVSIPDPRGNGQTIEVYNLARSKFGLVDELDTSSDANKRTYNGVDINVNARFANGAVLIGGTSTGRTRSVTCEVDDPNKLRFCDQTELDIPFQTTFKLSGTYPLPGDWRLSGVFQSLPAEAVEITYRVNRSIVPSLTVTEVLVTLNEPGSLYLDRVHQLDFSVSRAFRLGQVRLTPQIDLFNALNVSPVVNQVNTFGSAFGRPNRILDARLVRIGAQVEF